MTVKHLISKVHVHGYNNRHTILIIYRKSAVIANVGFTVQHGEDTFVTHVLRLFSNCTKFPPLRSKTSF